MKSSAPPRKFLGRVGRGREKGRERKEGREREGQEGMEGEGWRGEEEGGGQYFILHTHTLYPVPCRCQYTAGPDEGPEIVRKGRALLSVAMETTAKHPTVHQSIFCEPPT